MTSRRCVFIALFTVAIGGFSSPSQADTLGEAIAKAYKTNPELAAARADLEAVRELPEQARAGERPTIDAGIGGGYDNVLLGTNGAADVPFTWPVWTGGRVSAATDAAEANVVAGSEELRDIEADVIERVVIAYSDLLLAQQTVNVANVGIGRLDNQIAEAQLRFDLGRATLTDVAQLQAQRASVQENLAIAENNLAAATAAYRAVVGEEPGALSEDDPAPDGVPLTLAQAKDLALESNPVFLRQQRLADAAFFNIREAKAERAPTVELGASYARAAELDNGRLRDFQSEATIGVSIRIPLLTGGLVPSRVRESQARYRAQQFTADATEREVIRLTEVAWAALKAARDRLRTNRYREEAADLALQGILLEYNLGLRSTIDILVADDALRSAQIAVAASQADLLTAQVSLLRAVGSLDRQSYS